MKFWKEHPHLRLGLMAVLFAAGLALVVAGWRMTGSLSGVFTMLAGLSFLLGALLVYNKLFEEDRSKPK